MFCARCHGSMRSLAAFCPTCGHPVEAKATDVAAQVPTAAPELEGVDPIVGPPPRPLPRRTLVRAGVVGAGVGLAGLGGFFLVRRPPMSVLAIQVTPEQPFHVRVSRTADGPATEYDGAQPIELPGGDYYADVVPASRAFQRKRLKLHLMPGQMLALPVVLAGATRPSPLPPEPTPIPPPEAEPAPEPPRTTGKLACSSKPPGAQVYVDGRYTGKRTPVAISSAIELKPGLHTVDFRLDGRGSAPVEVRIAAGEVVVLKGIEIPD